MNKTLGLLVVAVPHYCHLRWVCRSSRRWNPLSKAPNVWRAKPPTRANLFFLVARAAIAGEWRPRFSTSLRGRRHQRRLRGGQDRSRRLPATHGDTISPTCPRRHCVAAGPTASTVKRIRAANEYVARLGQGFQHETPQGSGQRTDAAGATPPADEPTIW